MNNENQPAYPVENYKTTLINATGLTKLEVISSMCLQGLLSNPNNSNTYVSITKTAIMYAGQLLDELEQLNKPK